MNGGVTLPSVSSSDTVQAPECGDVQINQAASLNATSVDNFLPSAKPQHIQPLTKLGRHGLQVVVCSRWNSDIVFFTELTYSTAPTSSAKQMCRQNALVFF